MKPKAKKDKLKLKPTLKEKRHYLIIEVISSEKLNEQDIKNRIESTIKNFIGILGLASAGPLFVKIIDRSKEREKNTSISGNTINFSRVSTSKSMNTSNNTYKYNHKYLVTLSVTTKYVDYVKSSLILWKDKNLKMKCIGVSGTILKAGRFL